LEQRVAAALIGSSQFEQRNALFLRHPKKTRTGPMAVPMGAHSNRRNPILSIATPMRVLMRAFLFVATPCKWPGKMTEFLQSGHSAVAPASALK
jgi:hypothetical protein